MAAACSLHLVVAQRRRIAMSLMAGHDECLMRKRLGRRCCQLVISPSPISYLRERHFFVILSRLYAYQGLLLDIYSRQHFRYRCHIYRWACHRRSSHIDFTEIYRRAQGRSSRHFELKYSHILRLVLTFLSLAAFSFYILPRADKHAECDFATPSRAINKFHTPIRIYISRYLFFSIS